MSGEVRAIIYGVGAMGAIMTRLLHERGALIVGAVGRSPEKVGRDLGDVAGLGTHLGITVEDDARRVLSRGADIAVVCVDSYLETMRQHFAVCLDHGVNVVMIEEDTVYPWTTACDHAEALDRLARDNGVTLAASGAQDVFWLHLVSTLLGASHTIESVEGRSLWNVDDYGPEVAAHLHVGATRDEFEHHVAEQVWPEFVARATLEAFVSDLGFSVGTIESTVHPVIADHPVESSSLGTIIPTGRMLGVVDTTQIATAEGPRFSLAMEGRVHEPGQSDMNEWIVHGVPELHLRTRPRPLPACHLFHRHQQDPRRHKCGTGSSSRWKNLAARASGTAR